VTTSLDRDAGAGSSSVATLRTRSDLEKIVKHSANPLKVKEESMDCTDTNSGVNLPRTVFGGMIDMTGESDDLDEVFLDNTLKSARTDLKPNVSLQATEEHL
jgi:hypothetical protein